MACRLPSTPEFGHLHKVELPTSGEDFSTDGIAKEDRAFHAATKLWQRRGFLGAVILRSTLLLAIVAILLPATYESKAELMPPDQQSGAVGMLAALAGGGTGSLGSSASGGS